MHAQRLVKITALSAAGDVTLSITTLNYLQVVLFLNQEHRVFICLFVHWLEGFVFTNTTGQRTIYNLLGGWGGVRIGIKQDVFILKGLLALGPGLCSLSA